MRPDPLPVKMPGRMISIAGRILPGIGRVNRSIPVHTAWWSAHNAAQPLGGPTLVALGDSTALGIGASHPSRSYVGLLVDRLEGRRSVFDLAMSGARVADGLDRQLPQLRRLLPTTDDLVVTCGIGSNDVFWDSTDGLESQLRRLVGELAALEVPVVLLDIAGRSSKARRARRHLAAIAATHDLPIAKVWDWPLGGLGAVASDRFHPNDKGYRHMDAKLWPLLEPLVDGSAQPDP